MAAVAVVVRLLLVEMEVLMAAMAAQVHHLLFQALVLLTLAAAVEVPTPD
tara:strand:+ start:462 stop:611 length:150 start_codon:yes stop_codon:yes gene_type:complete